ncbi:unnamed protein product (macronuclear) [Paramecium tetraurelia]|uniref:SEC7 domain-containing protein n=1 Tax=Paramecium tetraurelia TaxID=5888 RepID=A0ED56_PARTE|nr:uncharacterized protein GSPATT00004092001 [Paramecium tetraurelia]CAK93223.1 unnamed protein product [Paramecium tetraurelia]|eukprot:XP_001460620.1 hypothetical protein (macronuclear) [Paramecium tetraurelia strain d4-2]
MGNTIQHKRRNPANCLGCMAQDHETFDPNELQIGLEVDKARGRITQQSTAYLTENEKNFFKAASGRNLGLIRFYLNNGININILDEDRTSPLHIASRYGSIQVVQELINNNANIDITDMAGWTPLHVAAFYQRAQVCSVLLKAGADPKIRNREGNLAQDLVRDKMTSEIFKSSIEIQNSFVERQVKRIDPAQRQHEEYFQFLKQQRLKSQECNSLCEKVSQGKLISPNLSPTKLISKEKENQGFQDSISRSIISENEHKDIQDCYKDLSSKINRNIISHQNSIPRSFDEMYSLNQLVLLQNSSRELVAFLDQVKLIKHDYNSENLSLDLFNHSSIIGISFMIATQMIKPTPQSIINWLFQDIELKNKVQISKLLCNINLQEQQLILKLFVDKIVMTDNLIDSLQGLFNKLLVQNDPFILDILVKEFSRRFYEFNFHNSKAQTFPFKSEESLHMFTFALVILDVQSDKYDKENAFKCFFQNIQTINNGDNLSSKFIQSIIEQLQSQQIVKLCEQQIDNSLYHVFNHYCTPMLLKEQKEIRSEKWKLYIISDVCILIADGKMKILSSSKCDIIMNKQEVTIQGKQNSQLIYFVCKDDQTFILKIKNKKFRFVNLQ